MMVYNVWNDPEEEIVETAITRFVDDISDDDIEEIIKSYKRPFPKSLDSYADIYGKLLKEMEQKYLIDIQLETNVDYFNQKLNERINQFYDLNLAEDIR